MDNIIDFPEYMTYNKNMEKELILINSLDFMERSLYDFISEYVEMKLLFDFYDVKIASEMNTYEDLNKENLTNLYKTYKKTDNCKFIKFYIPISVSMLETILKSYDKTKSIVSMLEYEMGDEIKEKNIPSMLLIKNQMIEKGHLFVHEIDLFVFNIFSYDIVFRIDFYKILYDKQEKKYYLNVLSDFKRL